MLRTRFKAAKHNHLARKSAMLRCELDRQSDSSRTLNRNFESPRAYFRCGRYFNVDHQWYASIREGNELGPYPTRDDVEMALANYVADGLARSPERKHRVRSKVDREPTFFEVLVQELLACRDHKRLRGENAAYVWATRRIETIQQNPGVVDRASARTYALEYCLRDLDR